MPQKRMSCTACKAGSLVWVGIGQLEVQCPKCGAEAPLVTKKRPKTQSSRKQIKTATKRKSTGPHSKVSEGKALVPAAQMNRLKNLVDELQRLVRDKDAHSHADVSLLKTSNMTLTSLLAFQKQIELAIKNIENRKVDLSTNLNDLSVFLHDLNRTVDGEGILTWGVRKLLEGINGQGSTEKQIKLAKELQSNLRRQSFELTREEESLKAIQKNMKTLLNCPASVKWKTVPETKFSHLAKAIIPSPAKADPVQQKKSTSVSSKSKHRQNLDLEGMSRPQLLEALYPEIADELNLHHARIKAPLSACVRSTELVWLVGQLWLVFLDGETFDWTDDKGLYEFVESMARKSPVCPVEVEASILMHTQATYMSDVELRLALSIAVKKVGTALVLNGNFDETLYGLMSYRDRTLRSLPD